MLAPRHVQPGRANLAALGRHLWQTSAGGAMVRAALRPPVGARVESPVSGRNRAQSSPRRKRVNSANPAPASHAVTYFGGAGRRSAKRRTLATPTECGKNSNIGASLGESPTK